MAAKFQLEQKWRAANPPEIHENALARAGQKCRAASGIAALYGIVSPLRVWCERTLANASEMGAL